MTTLQDFLVWYNNRDVFPFLQAINRQFVFYQQRGIDMFKQGISVPGLTLFYLFNDLPEKTYFTLFNEKNKDLITSSKITSLAVLRSFFTSITRKGSPRYVRTSTERRSSVSIDRRLRCQRVVLVVSHASHADGVVHARPGREQLPARIGTAVRTDGCGIVNAGSRTDGNLYPASGQRS